MKSNHGKGGGTGQDGAGNGNNGQGDGRVRVRARAPDGTTYVVTVPRAKADRLERLAQQGAAVLTVDGGGVVTSVHGGGKGRALPQRLARFTLLIDPPDFTVFMPQEWKAWVALWTQDDEPVRIMLEGPEGTGKDTLGKCLVQAVLDRFGAENTVVLTLPPEEDDRFVGHLETKADEFAQTVRQAKAAGKMVIAYMPEIESLFAAGEYRPSWDIQNQARMRDVIQGTRNLAADAVLATTNNLSRLGGPLLSRFRIEHVGMSEEFARGVFRAHWPSDLTDGLSCDYVLDQIQRQPLASMTLASRRQITLRAADLTGFNARLLADLAAEFRQRVKLGRRSQPGFTPDASFAAGVVQPRLASIVAPLVQAAGTAAIRQFLTRPVDLQDPPVAVEPTLDWCGASKYLVA